MKCFTALRAVDLATLDRLEKWAVASYAGGIHPDPERCEEALFQLATECYELDQYENYQRGKGSERRGE